MGNLARGDTIPQPDAVIAELDELSQHIEDDERPLARAVIRRVFESVTLHWKPVSPRRRELVRADVRPRFPFCLTGNTVTSVSSELDVENLRAD